MYTMDVQATFTGLSFYIWLLSSGKCTLFMFYYIYVYLRARVFVFYYFISYHRWLGFLVYDIIVVVAIVLPVSVMASLLLIL